ncbi:MAG: raffinose/stachyose/melibiose transport system permease protein [Gaiellales bacterium]|nr:raffinose/stachyose/melibiose transport system permease protein [Gaiellales bacterium]
MTPLRLSRPLVYLILAGITVVMLYPFYYMISTSLQSSDQYQLGSGGTSLASWHKLFDILPVWRQLLNSTIVSLAGIAVILLVSTAGGYAFAILRYRAATAVFLLVVGAMMVPLQSIIAPEFINVVEYWRINHLDSAIIVYAALGAPFSTFLMTTYLRRLPMDVIEAAMIDGLGWWRAYLRVILPLARPAMATIAVLQFIQIWDDQHVGLLFLQDPIVRPITVGLATIPGQHGLDVPMLMAGSLVSALPAVLVYLIFQRYLITGLTMGMGK